jgi:hypothetical protein
MRSTMLSASPCTEGRPRTSPCSGCAMTRR